MDYRTPAETVAAMLDKVPSECYAGNVNEAQREVSSSQILFAHQKSIFESLVRTAKAFGKANWFSLPVLPRWHVLMLAPTGTGKSHLARMLAAELGWSFYSLWTTRWIIAGGRGRETWSQIVQWLSSRNGKCIIFLDEVDKLGGEDTWSRHLRTEIYQLLDRELPSEITFDDSESEHLQDDLLAQAQKVLRYDCLFIAAGAFQPLWDYRPKPLGFSADSTFGRLPGTQELKSVLPPEFINRFGQVMPLSPLTERDYVAMAQQTAAALPAEMRKKFLIHAEKLLASAVLDGRGARYVEECITAALLKSRHVDHLEKPVDVTPQLNCGELTE